MAQNFDEREPEELRDLIDYLNALDAAPLRYIPKDDFCFVPCEKCMAVIGYIKITDGEVAVRILGGSPYDNGIEHVLRGH